MMIPIAGWVAPFGYPRINACSRLPVAFRSVPRPSSPPGAKASTECPSRAQPRHGPGSPDASRPCTETSHTPSPVPTGNSAQPSARASLTHTLHGAPERDTPSARSDRRKATPKKRTRTDLIANEQRRTAHGSQPARTHRSLDLPRRRSNPHPPHRTPRHAHRYARHGQARTREPRARRMETIGFEPMTPCLQSRCSPS